MVPVAFDSTGVASGAIPVFIPSGTICDVTVSFHARVGMGPRESGGRVVAHVLSPRAVHPLMDASGMALERLGADCTSRIAFNDSALEFFPGIHPVDGSSGYADMFRSRFGPVFTDLKGLPAAAVNGGWQLTVQRQGGRTAAGALECWELVIRTN